MTFFIQNTILIESIKRLYPFYTSNMVVTDALMNVLHFFDDLIISFREQMSKQLWDRRDCYLCTVALFTYVDGGGLHTYLKKGP